MKTVQRRYLDVAIPNVHSAIMSGVMGDWTIEITDNEGEVILKCRQSAHQIDNQFNGKALKKIEDILSGRYVGPPQEELPPTKPVDVTAYPYSRQALLSSGEEITVYSTHNNPRDWWRGVQPHHYFVGVGGNAFPRIEKFLD